ncbi:MAG: hypothetical protein ABL888_02405, partial [Pirellulaceae bacterium]
MNPNAFLKTIFSGLTVVLLFAIQANPASAQSPIKLRNWSGTIDLSMDNPVPFEMSGTASHLGRFTAQG